MKGVASTATRLLAATPLLLFWAGPAGAAAAPAERPAYENLRFEEDWSVLRDDPGPRHFLDPIKYLPFDAEGDYWLSLGGQIRGRVELWRNFLFGSSMPEKSDVYLLTRIRVHADLHLTPYFRAFAEFKSALATDRDLSGGRRPIDEDTAALQNAFGELRFPVRGLELGVRGGRQELQYGAQRLVSPLDWANARRTFDGVVAEAKGESWNVDGFWSRPVRVDQHDFNQSVDGVDFFGLYATGALPRSELGVDLFWLGIDSDQPRLANRSAGSEIRHTLGGRLHGGLPGTPLRLDLWGAAQVGAVGSDDIVAGAFSAKLTWPFAKAALRPVVYAGYDWASGDDGRGGSVGTFDQLFPLGHAYLGYIDAIARQNIHAVHGGARFSPFRRTVLALTWHAFWLDDGNDALYAASGSPIRFDPTASSQHVGVEMDLTVKVEVVTGLAGLVGYSHFFTGRYIAQTGPDGDVDFGYIQIQYTF